MISKTKKLLKHLTLGLPFVLSACGGGGSSTPTKPLSSEQILGATKSVNSAGWILSYVDGLQAAGLEYLRDLPTTQGNNETSPDISVCTTSGTYTATWRIADTTRWTVGDTVTLNLTDCVKTNGYIYNGTETYTVANATYGASALFVTITSDLTDIRLSSQKTTLTISSNKTQLTRITRFDSTLNVYTLPATYQSSGSIVATLTTSEGHIASGSYTISDAQLEDVLGTTTFTRKATLVSSDGTYNNIVLMNTQAKSDVNGLVTYPKYQIAYANASITATVSSSTTVLSGDNADGSPISALINYKYFD